MKSLWQKVVAMLRCWKVLVPLVMEGGYEGVTSSLEKMLIDAGNDRAPEAGEGLCCQA
jgi:hypothetical protein